MNGKDPPFGAEPVSDVDAPLPEVSARKAGPVTVHEYVPEPPAAVNGMVNDRPATTLGIGHGGPVMVSGGITRRVQLNVAGVEPILSWTVARIAIFPEALGDPLNMMELPVVADAVRGPETVQVYGATPPVTLNGMLTGEPGAKAWVGQVPVICNGEPTVMVQVNVTGVLARALGLASVSVTVNVYRPAAGAP